MRGVIFSAYKNKISSDPVLVSHGTNLKKIMPLPSPADLLRIWIGAAAGLWPQLHVLQVLSPLTLKTKFALDLSSLNTSLEIMKHTRHYLQATFYILKDSHGMLFGKPLRLTNASALVSPRGSLIAMII